jgi:choline-sulfatase
LIFAGPGVAKAARSSRPAELLDLYPTLIELCGLPARDGLEGHSLLPQLKDGNAARPWPAITTHNHDNHSIRSERWRYIVYADGSEELYDLRNDPNEWRNLAGDSGQRDVIEEHRKWIPKVNRKPAPGSAHRILVYEQGRAVWEGKAIGSGEAVPGI